MKSTLLTSLLATISTGVLGSRATVPDYSNRTQIGSHIVTCRVNSPRDHGAGDEAACSYGWTFLWKYAAPGGYPYRLTTGLLTWMLPAFGNTRHTVNCTLTSNWHVTKHLERSEDYLVVGGESPVTHMVFLLPVAEDNVVLGPATKMDSDALAFTFRPDVLNMTFSPWGAPYNRPTYRPHGLPEMSTGFYNAKHWSSCWVAYGTYDDKFNGTGFDCQPRIPTRPRPVGKVRPGKCAGNTGKYASYGSTKHNVTERPYEYKPTCETCKAAAGRKGNAGEDSKGRVTEDRKGYLAVDTGKCGCQAKDQYKAADQPLDVETRTPAAQRGCGCQEERVQAPQAPVSAPQVSGCGCQKVPSAQAPDAQAPNEKAPSTNLRGCTKCQKYKGYSYGNERTANPGYRAQASRPGADDLGAYAGGFGVYASHDHDATLGGDGHESGDDGCEVVYDGCGGCGERCDGEDEECEIERDDGCWSEDEDEGCEVECGGCEDEDEDDDDDCEDDENEDEDEDEDDDDDEESEDEYEDWEDEYAEWEDEHADWEAEYADWKEEYAQWEAEHRDQHMEAHGEEHGDEYGVEHGDEYKDVEYGVDGGKHEENGSVGHDNY